MISRKPFFLRKNGARYSSSVYTVRRNALWTMAGFQRANDIECALQRGPANFLLKLLLHPVEGGNDAQRGLFSGGLQRQQSAAGVGGIDPALHQSLRLQRGDGVADVAARCGEGLGQQGGLNGTGGLEEDRRQQQALHESKIVCREGFGCDAVEVACRTLHREHGTLAKEGFNAHNPLDVVYAINYLWQDKSIVALLRGLLDDRLMKKIVVTLSFCLLSARCGVCQQVSSSAGPAAQPAVSQPQSPISVQQSVQVTTTAEPLPLAESDRSVQVILPQDAPLGTDSVVDLLRTDPSLNLQARAGEGVQADLAIRGTTFEQSLVLVNGLRVDDPETGHLNLDIPVPLDAVTRVDVLHGSGSTFYGSDAIGGAVNLLTGAPGAGLSVVARSGAGNYGSLEEHLRAAYSSGPFAQQLTGSRDTSDGFIADRNYS